ncbi:MAG: glutamate-cysteine ligase family protein, partial [Promethearchaeota archaeon]
MSEKTTSDDETPLPFAHGIEVELQVIKKDGSWIRGEEILDIFDKLVSNAKVHLDNKIRASRVESVKRKYKQSTQTEEGERGSRIVASYEGPDGRTGEYTLVGHDPNVTSLTWILEVATPPCTTIEELAWWTQTLVAISYDALPKDARAILISTGLNPTQEYLRNLSFGEHHHILSPSVPEDVKIAVYNMVRNFIPHLIAISVNSPFENKKPTDEVSVDEDDITRAPRCKRSIRLVKNTTQLGPSNEFEFIPYLRSSDKEGFARHVNRGIARMVDLYPFTDYGTIELRVIDTQLSVPRRVGIALILQALALKAKRIVEAGGEIPDPGAKVLAANRSSAISAGLWGPFRPMEDTGTEFAQIYNHMISDDGTIDRKRRNRFVGDAVASMFYLIRNELEELDIVDNPFIQPILVSVFGSELSRPRTTGADLQLDVYAKSGMNMVALMRSLADITRECCTNWLFDPLEGTPQLPTWLCWWKGLEPEIVPVADRVFAGQEAEFVLTLRNTGPRSLHNLTVNCTIEDTDRNVSEQSIVSISSIDQGQIHVERIVFQTRRDVTAYNIIVAIGLGSKQVTIASTINTYWMRVQVKPGTTTQFADGQTPVLFSGNIETNYPETKVVNCSVAVVSLSKELVLVDTGESLTIEGGETVLFDNSNLP